MQHNPNFYFLNRYAEVTGNPRMDHIGNQQRIQTITNRLKGLVPAAASFSVTDDPTVARQLAQLDEAFELYNTEKIELLLRCFSLAGINETEVYQAFSSFLNSHTTPN